MKIDKNGTITSVKGFMAAGLSCGLKKSLKPDLALIYSEKKCIHSAVFTTNKACAAPIIVSKEHAKNDFIKAIIINSGVANTCTAQQGIDNAKLMCSNVATHLGIKSDEVLVSSTGLIGKQLDMEKVNQGISVIVNDLGSTKEKGHQAARALFTTDTFIKNLAVSFMINDEIITIGAIAKGSGMIHPKMATMLAFLTTNVQISKEVLDIMFKQSIQNTYNMISVDGDTSTNDMAIIMSNQTANNSIIDDINSNEAKIFMKALNYVNEYLAKKIVLDGEGASKFIEVNVVNGSSIKEARQVARSIVSSNLVKTAIYGKDPNWGRVICAIGYSSPSFNILQTKLSFCGLDVKIDIFEDGLALEYDEQLMNEILALDNIKIEVDLKSANYSAQAWGCDLTHEYVKINARYAN